MALTSFKTPVEVRVDLIHLMVLRLAPSIRQPVAPVRFQITNVLLQDHPLMYTKASPGTKRGLSTTFQRQLELARGCRKILWYLRVPMRVQDSVSRMRTHVVHHSRVDAS